MKYFNLSIFTMIITAFIMKVVRLVRGKKRPGLVPNGLTPEEWDYAMSQAKICREMELVLQISNGSSPVSIEWVLGPSLGDAADLNFMHWCWRNLEQSNGFYLSGIDKRLTPRGGGAYHEPAVAPFHQELGGHGECLQCPDAPGGTEGTEVKRPASAGPFYNIGPRKLTHL